MNLPDGLLLSFYGDDFTGSTDTMEVLAKAGLRTALFLEPPSGEMLSRFDGLRAVGVAGVSRSLTPREMDRQLPPIFGSLRHLGAPLFHVKVCSTFDSAPEIGSIGHTIGLGRRVFGSDFVPLVVGAPALHRFCVFGSLFARSGPESEVFRLDRHPTMSRHPVTPMEESDLRLHLAQQTSQGIGLIDVLQLDLPQERMCEEVDALTSAGQEIVLFDTLTPQHLTVVGQFLWQRALSHPPLFVVGSSGVEYALAGYWQAQNLLPEPPEFPAEAVEQIVVVSGSCSPVTARQIAWAEARGFAVIALDPIELLEAEAVEARWETPLREALAALDQGRSVVLHTCLGPEDPRLVATRAYLAQTGEDGSGRELGQRLGRLLKTLLERSRVRRAVVAGGDTCGYAAREMGITALEMAAPMAPGSPLCHVYAEDKIIDGMQILFKGGQVGRIDLFGSILKGSV